MDPLCCFEEVYTIIFKVANGMYEYPIFKHLVQFSNLVDPVTGKLQKGPDMPPMPINNQHYGDESDDDGGDDDEKEGGERSHYEGGESDQGNHGQTSSQANGGNYDYM